MKITVLGSGGWGTALALLLLENGHEVTLWSYTEEESRVLRETRENPMLKGVPLPETMGLTTDMGAVKGCGAVVMATPSFAVRATAAKLKQLADPGTIVISVSKGIEIMEALRGHTSGYCVPTFVVDAPGGGGKTPVMPNYLISETPRKVILRNFEGVITSYTQPEHYVQDCHCDVCMGKKKAEKTGVAWVAEGTKQRYLEPTKLLRNERHVKK